MRVGLYTLLAFACAGCSASPSSDPALPATAGTKLAAEDRELSFQAKDLTLVGTLSLPERVAGVGVPGVVLIAGSGPSSRDEQLAGQLGMSFGFRFPAFRLLAEALRADGIAVLRYDKRSCGRFNGCADNDYPLPADDIVVEAFEHDAIAGVDYLQALPDVDATRVSVIGHSEGGALVIPILAERSDIAAGVLVSAPFQPIDQIVHAQTEFLRTLLVQFGAAQADVEVQLAPYLAIEGALAEIRAGTYSGGAIAGAYEPYWASLMSLGDRNVTQSEALDRGLLAIGGSYDWNVPPSELAGWQHDFETAASAGERKTQLLACMTHALNCVSQPDLTKLEPSDIGTTLHAELAPTIAEFIRSH